MTEKGTGKESDILLTELHSASICEMWASLLWVVGRYKNTRLRITMLRASRRFLQRLLLSRVSEGLIRFMIQIRWGYLPVQTDCISF